MIIKPIRTEHDYDDVLDRIDELIEAKPDTPEFDELEVLSVLAEAYEEKHYPIDAPDPVEALKCIMEWKGLKNWDLEPYIGTRAKVSEILKRQKGLTLDMIIRLKKGLGVPADILIPDTDCQIPIAV